MVTRYLVTYDTYWQGMFLHNTIYCNTLRKAINTARSVYLKDAADFDEDEGILDDETLSILECSWDIDEELADVAFLDDGTKPDVCALLWSARYSAIDICDLKPKMLSKSRLNIEDTPVAL